MHEGFISFVDTGTCVRCDKIEESPTNLLLLRILICNVLINLFGVLVRDYYLTNWVEFVIRRWVAS